jgi:hypothetical protein
MTITFTLNLLTIVTVLAAVFALLDGTSRTRNRRGSSLLTVAEIVFAALMLISIFVVIQPLTNGTFLFAMLLLITLVLIVLLPSRRGTPGASRTSIIAIVLSAVVVLVALGWLNIPGLG